MQDHNKKLTRTLKVTYLKYHIPEVSSYIFTSNYQTEKTFMKKEYSKPDVL